MRKLERPDGSVVTPVGWCLIVAGFVGAIIGASSETLAGMLFGFGLANLGFGLGVLLLALAYLVRAIWFLPGREITVNDSRSPPPASAACAWCDRDAAAGSRTCSYFAAEELHEAAPKVVEPICQEQLRQRGYAVQGDRQ